MEQDPGAAMTARERLDDVFMLNVQVDTPPLEPGSLDCVLLGDVLEHLVDPEDVLRRYREPSSTSPLGCSTVRISGSSPT